MNLTIFVDNLDDITCRCHLLCMAFWVFVLKDAASEPECRYISADPQMHVSLQG